MIEDTTFYEDLRNVYSSVQDGNDIERIKNANRMVLTLLYEKYGSKFAALHHSYPNLPSILQVAYPELFNRIQADAIKYCKRKPLDTKPDRR